MGDKPERELRSAVGKGDEIALHVHCWRELIADCELEFQATPGWNGDGTGHGVPFGGYGEHVAHIVGRTRTLLERKLSATVHGFRCGGAMTSDGGFDALMKHGLRHDCSAFSPEIVSRGFSRYTRGNLRDCGGARNQIAHMLVDLWGYVPVDAPERANRRSLQGNGGCGIGPLTQPYLVRARERSIIEMPQGGGISDYACAGHMLRTFRALLHRVRRHGCTQHFILGCHQEGAGRWKKALMEFCRAARNELNRPEIQFTTVAKSAKIAAKRLRRAGEESERQV